MIAESELVKTLICEEEGYLSVYLSIYLSTGVRVRLVWE